MMQVSLKKLTKKTILRDSTMEFQSVHSFFGANLPCTNHILRGKENPKALVSIVCHDVDDALFCWHPPILSGPLLGGGHHGPSWHHTLVCPGTSSAHWVSGRGMNNHQGMP